MHIKLHCVYVTLEEKRTPIHSSFLFDYVMVSVYDQHDWQHVEEISCQNTISFQYGTETRPASKTHATVADEGRDTELRTFQ